jgi:leucyl/phenylalanyl-tRNA--protein transferase
VARLRRGGFTLLDTQFVTEHLAQFGAEEVPRRVYKKMLTQAIERDADWNAWPLGRPVTGSQVLDAL